MPTKKHKEDHHDVKESQEDKRLCCNVFVKALRALCLLLDLRAGNTQLKL